jgi:hypothetical protein
LAAIPILIIAAFILHDALEPESEKEKASAEDFVESSIISPKPTTMIWYKTLDYANGNLAGDAAACTAAYTLGPGDFSKIMAAHKWMTPTEHFVSEEFHQAWPQYKGEIEEYYYDDGDAGTDLSGYSTVMAVSADHTMMVFDSRDAWARPFEKH